PSHELLSFMLAITSIKDMKARHNEHHARSPRRLGDVLAHILRTNIPSSTGGQGVRGVRPLVLEGGRQVVRSTMVRWRDLSSLSTRARIGEPGWPRAGSGFESSYHWRSQGTSSARPARSGVSWSTLRPSRLAWRYRVARARARSRWSQPAQPTTSDVSVS